MRKREGFVKQAAIFAAAALVVPAAAQAKEDPGEELEEILETQMEQGEKSLLSKTLGLDELQENMEEEGFSVQTKFGVSRETWELLGVEAPTSEDGYLQMNLRAAEDAERWQFDLEAATDENTKFLTLSLYADEDQLAVSIPQFYDGALAIRSGSLLQQYNGSWLEQMLDQPLEEDVDLSFVPGEQEEDETQEDDSWELVKDAARVEKSEQGDETVYSVIVPTETFLDFCQEQYETLIEQLSGVTTVTEYGDPNEFFACLKNAMEEELTLDFYTRHGFVTNVALEATIDTAEFEEYRKELREEGAPDGPTASFWVSVPGFHTEVGGMQEDTAGQNTDAASDIIGGADGSTDIYLGMLRHIVVRAAGKAHQLVAVLAAGGQHDDGHIGKLPYLHAGVAAGQAGHHHVHDDQVEVLLLLQLHGGRAVIGGHHLIPLVLQIELHALHQQLLVVYHQYLHSCVSSVMM